MEKNKIHNYIKDVLNYMPKTWLSTSTHRLDIYNEHLAKTQFLEEFELLYNNNNVSENLLNSLPTAYDYIRLGHPLSCVLEWTVAMLNHTKAENIISFSSKTIPIFAILRTNLLKNKNTKIYYINYFPECIDIKVLKSIYGYKFDLIKVEKIEDISFYEKNCSTIFITQQKNFSCFENITEIDFLINVHSDYGSVLLVNGLKNEEYVSAIQHVRRRETIAMTPINCLATLNIMINKSETKPSKNNIGENKKNVIQWINKITGIDTKPLISSSGLSIQYAILMGLIDNALEKNKGKVIKIIVPPNCYGGTNNQARRVAACIDNVDVMDFAVDGGNDMVKSLDIVLEKIAQEDAVPFIIAEIPTNPRVEVPNLVNLKDVLNKKRKTIKGEKAIEPIFILDQTFCPNVHFLGENEILSNVKTISFASGSKFPSGGKCTSGYCIGNRKTDSLMQKIEQHLFLCDNKVTKHQLEILAIQLPSMNQRIISAYKNTREFVNYIREVLPKAKINFVSEELADQGFMPSVFSLDLPTVGNTTEEKESNKRKLNNKLIQLMIKEIPNECKNCVSYGQLKGSYWTIPATSTQGTTKEGDKDYIVRVALSPILNLERHKKVFLDFVRDMEFN